jgi:hypothetical protein
MPFKSERQRRFLWMKHPDLARKWAHETGSSPTPRKKRTRKRHDPGTSKKVG